LFFSTPWHVFRTIVSGDLAMDIISTWMSAIFVGRHPVPFADKFRKKEVKGGVPFLGEKGLDAGF
jgi:hypothetical protein